MKKDITEEQRENFNAAQIGWGTRKVIKNRKVEVLGKWRDTPLIIPQTFLSICGMEFDISNESFETFIEEAIKFKLDIYHKSDSRMIKCSDAMYETNNTEKEGDTTITDLTGDMTDEEFELIVDEIYERMKDNMYQIGKQRIRNTLDRYRANLLTLGSMEIVFNFVYNNGEFNQILGRIRRKK